MSSPATPPPSPTGGLLSTIITDLHAGESWFLGEAEGAGLFMWNLLKGAFIALEPAAGKVLLDTLTGAVAGAAAGDSVEQIQTAALNTASSEGKAALVSAGSAVAQQLIIGLRANLPAASTPPAGP